VDGAGLQILRSGACEGQRMVFFIGIDFFVYEDFQSWHDIILRVRKRRMKKIFIIITLLSLLEASAQYQVEWKQDFQSQIASIVSYSNSVIVGDRLGNIGFYGSSNTPDQRIKIKGSVMLLETSDNYFYSLGIAAKKFSYSGNLISSDSIVFDYVAGSRPSIYHQHEGSIYAMHKFRYLSKHNLEGNFIWQIVVDENASNLRFAVTKNSIYVYSAFYSGGNYISRYDTAGVLVWRKGAGSFVDQVLADTEGNYYLLGALGHEAYLVVKYNENGGLIWQNIHSRIQPANGTFYGDSLLLGGGSYFEGKKRSAIHILSKTTGESIAEHYVDVDPNEQYGEIFNNVVFCGIDFYCSGYYGEMSPFLVKLSDARLVGIKETSVSLQRFTVFPNPSSSVFTVKMAEPSAQPVRVRVSNSMGQLVYEEKRKGLENEFDVNLAGFARGVYFIELRTAGKSEVQKIILE
jgi:hypothetical protein